MGKPYITELRQLHKTYSALMEMDVSRLEKTISSTSSLPLFTIGSGGSLSASHFVTFLHQIISGQFSKSLTPLEATEILPNIRNSALCFMSAGGRNSDINAAFRRIVLQEPKCLITVCARTGSPLSQIANRYDYTEVYEFEIPSKRDGFLATNSLVAFCILFARAYLQHYNLDQELPMGMWELLNHKGSTDSYLSILRNRCNMLWERDNIVVLFGPSAMPAAHDLESKFTEAALGSVLLSDYRNFAHGRHHWLAKRGKTSAVLAFSTDRDKKIADKTVGLLPTDIPVVKLHFPGQDIRAAAAALITVLHIVALAGEARNIDPGRPGVPSFGRKIYHLRGITYRSKSSMSRMAVASRRKLAVLGQYPGTEYTQFMEKAYKTYIRKLGKQDFNGIVFDYDGTLCGKDSRFGDMDIRVSEELKRILKAKIPIGIATGRGKSARIALQKALPKSLWSRVLLGYYNGADCGILNEDTKPDGTDIPCPDLETLAGFFIGHPAIQNQCEVTVRKYQITIEALPNFSLDQTFQIVAELVERYGTLGTKLYLSSHSIDVLAPSVSKRSVIKAIRDLFSIQTSNPILCIGDRGLWPGNDFELLYTPFSLSVDEVSSDPETCWNIAPAGYRGIQATLYYLECIKAGDGTFHFNMNQSKASKR